MDQDLRATFPDRKKQIDATGGWPPIQLKLKGGTVIIHSAILARDPLRPPEQEFVPEGVDRTGFQQGGPIGATGLRKISLVEATPQTRPTRQLVGDRRIDKLGETGTQQTGKLCTASSSE